MRRTSATATDCTMSAARQRRAMAVTIPANTTTLSKIDGSTSLSSARRTSITIAPLSSHALANLGSLLE